jgi:hypothetical protein
MGCAALGWAGLSCVDWCAGLTRGVMWSDGAGLFGSLVHLLCN